MVISIDRVPLNSFTQRDLTVVGIDRIFERSYDERRRLARRFAVGRGFIRAEIDGASLDARRILISAYIDCYELLVLLLTVSNFKDDGLRPHANDVAGVNCGVGIVDVELMRRARRVVTVFSFGKHFPHCSGIEFDNFGVDSVLVGKDGFGGR